MYRDSSPSHFLTQCFESWFSLFISFWLQFVNLQILPWTKQSEWLQPALAFSSAEGLFGVQWTRKKERKREQIMFSTRTDAIIVNLRIFFLCTDFSFPLLSVLYNEGNYKTMDFQNPLTPAAFVLYCIAQISQCALLENNGVEKGSSEVSGSMMQSCSCLGFSAHFLRINEVQYFEQVTRRGYFSQTLVFPVSKTIHTNWPRLERAFSKTHCHTLNLCGSREPFCCQGRGSHNKQLLWRAVSGCWWNSARRWIRDR